MLQSLQDGGQALRGAPRLYKARLSDIWKFMVSQPLSFWLLCLYMGFEYVRPQDTGYFGLLGSPLPFWTIIACTAAYLFEGRFRRRWTAADTWICVFSVVIVLSSINAYVPDRAFSEWSLFFSWALIYLLITSIVTTEQRFFVFILMYLVYCIKMTQHGVRSWAFSGFSFMHSGVGCAPSWFQNSGECGIQMAMLLPVALFFLLPLKMLWSKRKYWVFFLALPVGAAITITASSSRGALLALAGLSVWIVVLQRRFRTLMLVAISVGVVWLIIPPEQKERLGEMGDDADSVARITFWTDGIQIMREHPFLGVGYRNWLPYYRDHYYGSRDRLQLPHNIFIEAGAELGYLGLFAFLGLIGATFHLNYQTRKLSIHAVGSGGFFRSIAYGFDGALIGYMIGGFFVTVLYYPFFWINLAMTVSLHCVTRSHAIRSRQGSRTPVSDRRRAQIHG
jgi:O-antigen ligase